MEYIHSDSACTFISESVGPYIKILAYFTEFHCEQTSYVYIHSQ